MGEYNALSDFAKLFVADYLAVHVNEEELRNAVEYGKKAEESRDLPQVQIRRCEPGR
jgi:hypothetical protein